MTKRSMELRIWHHFLTYTALTLPPPHRSDIQSLWTEDVPQWAFKFDFLLDSLLGLTAIHMYTMRPQESQLLAEAYKYYAEAANKYRRALSGINEETAGPILATSLFIGFQSKIVPRLHAANEPHYRLPIGFFLLQRGVPTTYKAVAPFLQGHRMMIIMFASMPPVEEVLNCEDDAFLPDDVANDRDKMLHALASMLMTDEAVAVCRTTFAYVLAIHRSIEKEEPEGFTRRRITAFPGMVPWPFVELLEQHNPIAVLILARYFAISKAKEDLWWIRGFADREVSGINSIIGSEWRGFMQFPLDVLGGWDSPLPSVRAMSSQASNASMSPGTGGPRMLPGMTF